MLSLLTLALAVSGSVVQLAEASPAPLPPRQDGATNPIIDLGSAGSYMGVIQNNGTSVDLTFSCSMMPQICLLTN